MRHRTAQFEGRADASMDSERVVPRGVAKAIRFMQDNLAVHLSVDEIAIAATMSERTLRRQFRRFTGQSPVAFHRNLRLAAARRALHDNHTETDITAVAGALGFSHFSHFTAQYRRRFGELPSETLRSARETLVQLPPHQVHGTVTLAILPFTYANAQSADLALAGATTDLLISELGRARWINVLGSKGDVVGDVQTRRAAPYSAQYAVRGRVHSLNGRVQVTVRLFEIATGRHIWGNAFEGKTEDLGALENLVIEGVASALPIWLRRAEAARNDRKPARDPAAYDLTMRAFRDASALTQATNERALEAVNCARSIDPEFGLPTALAAWCHAQRAIYFFGGALDAERDTARRLIALTLGTDNEHPLVLAVLGTASTLIGDLDLADLLIGKCLAIDPYCSMAWQRRGWLAFYRGRNTALADFSRCLALDPDGPERLNSLMGLSCAHFQAGNYDQAADWAVRGVQEGPSATWALRIAAQAQPRCGRTAEARQNVALLLRKYPDMTVSSIISAVPMHVEVQARCAESLEAAGLPV
jgi:adenylate cyclase